MKFSLVASLGIGWALLGMLCACDEAPRPVSTASTSTTPAKPPAESPPHDPLERAAAAEAELPKEARLRARRAIQSMSPAASNDAQKPEAALLGDEQRLVHFLLASGEARSWAAFALGRRCSRAPNLIEPLLLSTAATSLGERAPPSPSDLEVFGAALGECATLGAETTLRHWLRPPPAAEADVLVRAAAIGLGQLADARGTLSEETLAALLDVALERKDRFLIYPLSRLYGLGPAVSQRLLEVAGSLLVEERGPSKTPVILALGAASEGISTPALGQILLAQNFSPSEQSAAAQALGRLGAPGQKVLDEALVSLLGRGLPLRADDVRWLVLRAALDALDRPERSQSELRKLSTWAVPESDQPQRRRVVWLRCRAASLLAGDRTSSQTLKTCDPDAGPAFELAQIEVLGRSRIELKRRQAFDERLASPHPFVVTAALRLVASHPELGDVRPILRAALGSSNEGARATAAKVLAAYPARASDPKHPESGPDAEIVARLRAILEQSGPRLPEETIAAAIAAAASLASLALKPAIEVHCDGPRLALQDAARRALPILGSPTRRCPKRDEPTAVASAGPSAPLALLELTSDFGPLRIHLDRAGTEHARWAVLERAKAGELTAGPVHAFSPGFSVQFGDPDGDGFEPSVPLAVEPLELDFASGKPLSVFVSSFAPGASGHQLLVALEELQSLAGRRVLLGHAEGPWHLLWPGDRLRDVKVVER